MWKILPVLCKVEGFLHSVNRIKSIITNVIMNMEFLLHSRVQEIVIGRILGYM